MIEIPEAIVLSKQINEKLKGKKIVNAIAMNTPHKLVWVFKDPKEYGCILKGSVINKASAIGSTVEINCNNDIKIALSEGFNLRYIVEKSNLPEKHQLLLEFDDGTYFVAYVQMYGGLACFSGDQYDNKYYLGSRSKPAPTTAGFSKAYWNSLFTSDTEKLSAKAFLATEQRIPGLGNGVLQDIFFNAGIHPKRKILVISQADRDNLYAIIISTLTQMVDGGGRDTEKDLYGNEGGYKTIMSAKTCGLPCPKCKGVIKKLVYLGGSVYVCERCQQLD